MDTVDDNIYVWNVKMSNFGNESLPLEQECAQLMKQYGYNFIELQMGESLVQFDHESTSISNPSHKVTQVQVLGLPSWHVAFECNKG